MARRLSPWNHRRCSSHVAVDGVGRVCVLRGQDPAAVLEFARWAAAAGEGRRIPKAGPARTAPSAEALRHSSCSAHVAGRDWGLGSLCVARGSSVGDVLVFAGEVARAREAQAAALADRVARARAMELELSPAEAAAAEAAAASTAWIVRLVDPRPLVAVA